MKIVAGISFFFLLCIFPSSHAIAFSIPCTYVGIGLLPVHPQPKDQIEFIVGLTGIPPTDSAGTPRFVVSKVRPFGFSSEVTVDIFLTTDKAPFPGYEVDP